MTTLALPASREAGLRAGDRSVRRRVGVIWALLFFNVLAYAGQPTIVAIPHRVAQVLTQGALGVALLLALTVNRRLVVRPNAFLVLFSIAATFATMISIRDNIGIGSDIRAGRLIAFLMVLWLLTPWWGRRDLMLPRIYVGCLIAVLALVLLGIVISPGTAFEFQNRLGGDIWPIPPTQVAHYAAVTGGVVAVAWLSGLVRRNVALTLFLASVAILLLTHTRTALVAMLAGILVAAFSLFTRRRRVRKAFFIGVVIALIATVLFLPALSNWFTRGQSTQELTSFTGRSAVWTALVHAPRSEADILFGFGLSNNSFNGLSIDNSWFAVYQDQGLVGDVLTGVIVLALALTALLRSRGPARAIALFLLVYCVLASFTETGLGQASPYLLDLAVVASILAPPPPTALLDES